MSVPTRRILDPVFGSPILRHANNGTATWSKVNTSSQWQKGTGWQACLYGGVQTGDDWGAVFIPTLEQRVSDFNSAQWSYYMTGTQTMGVNLVIWVHNPENENQRAEITQIGSVAGLGKTAGWNSHKLVKTTDQFVWYGEDWSTGSAVALTGSGLTSGTQYGWDDFQADVLFRGWTIYRVSLEYGWEASGTLDYVWVVEAKFNGQSIPFIPSLAEILASDSPLASVILRANSGVDIGDVDVSSIATGTNAIGRVGHDTTAVGHGVMTVTTAGTDLVLAASTACKWVIIQAQTDNTSAVAVGATGVDATIATGTGILLYAGDWTPTLMVDNLADIYVDSLVNGEGVRYIYGT